MEELRRLNAKPLRPSPDGELMAFSVAGAGFPFGIEIRSISDGKRIGEIYSAQPLVNVRWRPDSKALVYFRQNERAERHLVIWDVAHNSHQDVITPVTHNQYEVKWSPDGSSLAFSSDETELIVIGVNAVVRRVSGWFRSFSWSPDSRKIGLIIDSHSRTDKIVICDIENGTQTSLQTEKLWNLITLEWAPFSEILVRGQTTDKSRSSLIVIDPQLLKANVELDADGDITRPQWLPGKSGLIWTTQPKGTLRQLVLSERNGAIRFKSQYDGNTTVLQLTPDEKGAFISIASPKQFSIAKISFLDPSGRPDLVTRAIGQSAHKSVQEILSLRMPDGGTIKIDISEPAEPPFRSRAAVVRMLGGAEPEFAANWAERQLYLKHGVTYIGIPYRKLSAPDDLLQVCKFLREEEKIDPAKIVVYGASTAATVILDAAMRSSGSFGTAVIVGLGKAPVHMKVDGLNGTRLFAFHGAVDPFPPDSARRLLIDAVGEKAILRPYGLWHVFPGEAHSLNSADGVVHSTILAELGLIDR